ncbi:hypothetical protein BE08_04515 [Sorangium cellulosum]|uniref:Uncharacterized protein n=1 Tax=Sorangium cellulosum TaxID=56 RepID=A0A150PPL3_SORCE|nr:hypothetical protein BE08_04515 [Sorangium cellulosum]
MILRGHDLAGATVRVKLTRSLLPAPYELTPDPASTATQVVAPLPDDQAGLPAGAYAASVAASPSGSAGDERESNALPLSIAPRIRQISPQPVVRDPNGQATVTLLCSPEVWPDQRASLIVGDAEFLAAPRTAKSDTLEFTLSGLPAVPRTYFVRLRIDGVDSLLIDHAAPAPAYDPSQTMVVQ